jgi:hypothetical protein
MAKEFLAVSPEDTIAELWLLVFKREISMREAESRLQIYMASLSEEKRSELKPRLRPMAMSMMGISEGFQQVLTVLGAG